jgi:hypothetical protein
VPQAHLALASTDGWVDEARRLLAHLGFLLVNGDSPGEPGGANLLLALRTPPTGEHFDPEAVCYWRMEDGRARQVLVDRSTRAPVPAPWLWGQILVVDRLGETNRFLGFGGELRVADVDPSTRLVVFHSPAAIVRWAGHSQSWDEIAGDVGAFFARLRARIDARPALEVELAQTPPAALYAAFVAYEWDRIRALHQADPEALHPAARWVAREVARLATGASDRWSEGRALLTRLDLRAGHAVLWGP